MRAIPGLTELTAEIPSAYTESRWLFYSYLLHGSFSFEGFIALSLGSFLYEFVSLVIAIVKQLSHIKQTDYF